MLKTQMNALTLRPSQWRLTLFRVLLMAAAFQFAVLLFNLFSDNLDSAFAFRETWMAYSLPFVAAYGVSLLRSTRAHLNDLSVQIVGNSVEGPTGRGWKRTRIAMEKIDVERTRRTTLANWAMQYRYIYAKNGDKILVHTHGFTNQQLETLFKEIGCC